MAGIGDYVHFHISNYRSHGTTFDSNDSTSFVSAYNNNHEKLKQLVNTKKVSDAQCAMLSNFYTDLFYNKSNLLNKQVRTDNNKKDTFSQVIADAVQRSSQISTANAINPSMVEKILGVRLNKLATTVKSKAAIEGSKISSTTLNKYANSIKQMKNNAQRAFESNQGIGDFNKLYPSVEVLRNAIDQLDNQLTDLMRNKLNLNSSVTKTRYFKTDKISEELKSIYTKYWDLIHWYQSSFGGVFAGDVSEITAVLGEAIAAGRSTFTTNYVNMLLNQGWKGSKIKSTLPMATGINLGGGLQMGVDVAFKQNIKQSKGVTYTYDVDTDAGTFGIVANFPAGAGAKGLIDIVINPTGDAQVQKKLGVSDVAASLKNYSNINASYGKDNSNGVSLIKSTPLLSILTDMDTVFVNHFLNLLGAHDNSGKKISIDKDKIMLGRREIKYAGAINGLVGRHGNNRNNDILVVNDKATKRVYIMPVSKLVDNENALINAITMKINPEISAFNTKLNSWYGKDANFRSRALAQGRIGRYLATLYNSKLMMSLKPSGIENLSIYK